MARAVEPPHIYGWLGSSTAQAPWPAAMLLRSASFMVQGPSLFATTSFFTRPRGRPSCRNGNIEKLSETGYSQADSTLQRPQGDLEQLCSLLMAVPVEVGQGNGVSLNE